MRYACHALPIFECLSCRHQFAIPENPLNHVAAVYGDDHFFGGGAGYSNYLEEKDLLIARGVGYAQLLAKHTAAGRVLDMGSAAGFLLRGMLDEGWEGMGIEPNRYLSDYAQAELQVESQCCSFEDFQSDSPFDAVTMIQVISHLIDPASAIQKASDLLKPKGLLLIETWDRGSWVARLLGSRWHEYSPPSVLHWFTRESLSRLLTDNSLQVIASGRPFRWISVGHAKSLIRYKYGRAASATLGWLPTKLSIPYLAGDLFWILARRQDDR